MSDRERFLAAIARFDAANAVDPHTECIEGEPRPKELVYAQRMTAMLARFAPDASQALQLAARSQHIQRWRIPRSDFPDGRTGYLQWRKRLQELHASVAADILRAVGYDDATIARVGALLRKERLKADAEAQALEDVIALVFLESYLAGFVAGHAGYDGEKFAEILRKTARKMSPRGRLAAVELIALPAELAPLVRRVIAEAVPPPA